jgi:transposase
MPVMIGVDPHKASHTAAALNEHGQLLGQLRIPATLDGYQALRRWAGRWPDRCGAVEGAHGVGRAVAQRLVGDGEPVLDVPAKLAARVRVLSVGHGRKSDAHDAVSVAAAARNAAGLRQVTVEDQATVLHLLTKRRQDLVAARTQTINPLHRLLMDLTPGGTRRILTAKRAAGLLASITPAGAPAVTRWQLATELVADVRHLEQRIAAVEARIKTAVAQTNTQPARAVRGGAGAGRHLPRRGRRHRPVPNQGPLRRPHRHRPAGGLQRPGSPPPAVAGRGPQAQSRPVHDGHGPGPPARSTTGESSPRASRPRKPCGA